jgi:hypothetical protein
LKKKEKENDYLELEGQYDLILNFNIIIEIEILG